MGKTNDNNKMDLKAYLYDLFIGFDEEEDKLKTATPKKAAGSKTVKPKKAAEFNAVAPKKVAEPKQVKPKKAAEPKTVKPKKAAEPKTVAPKKAAEPKQVKPKKTAEPKTIKSKKSLEVKEREEDYFSSDFTEEELFNLEEFDLDLDNDEDFDDEAFDEYDVMDGGKYSGKWQKQSYLTLGLSIVVVVIILLGGFLIIRGSIESTQLSQARTCIANGAYDEAINCCKKVVAVNGKSEDGNSLLIQAYIGAKRYDEGYEALQTACSKTGLPYFVNMKEKYYPSIKLSADAGEYVGEQTISVQCNSDDKVYFTINGEDPTPGKEEELAENKEIKLDVGSWNLKVITVSPYGVVSKTEGGEYNIASIIVTMPNLVGKKKKTAEKKMKALGLTTDITYEEVLPEKVGKVISQAVEEDTQLEHGNTVGLVIGVEMPIVVKYREYIADHYTLSRCHVILADITHTNSYDLILLVKSNSGYTLHVLTVENDEVRDIRKEYCDTDIAYGLYETNEEKYLFRYSESGTPEYEVFSLDSSGNKKKIQGDSYKKAETDATSLDDSAEDNSDTFYSTVRDYYGRCSAHIVNTTNQLGASGTGCLLSGDTSVENVLGSVKEREEN